MAQPINIHTLNNMEISPRALLHKMTPLSKREWEISDLEKHIKHLETTGKVIDEKYQSELNRLNSTLSNFTDNRVELTIWSLNKISVGDVIDMQFYKKTFVVEKIISVADHKGRFTNPAHAVNSFYTLFGTVTYYGKVKKTPAEEAAKDK